MAACGDSLGDGLGKLAVVGNQLVSVCDLGVQLACALQFGFGGFPGGGLCRRFGEYVAEDPLAVGAIPAEQGVFRFPFQKGIDYADGGSGAGDGGFVLLDLGEFQLRGGEELIRVGIGRVALNPVARALEELTVTPDGSVDSASAALEVSLVFPSESEIASGENIGWVE